MVGPGEVDEDLEPETAEECTKYGKVIKCMIFEVKLFLFINNKILNFFFNMRLEIQDHVETKINIRCFIIGLDNL